MSIESLGELDEANSFPVIFSHIGDLNGKKIEILSQKSAIPSIRLETRLTDHLSLKNHQFKPMMLKVGVSHTDKNGEKIEGYVELDTRDPQKQNPPPPPPPQPTKPKNS